MKTLIVYYSRTGNTEKVANEIAKIFNGEIEKIIDKKNRKGIIGLLISGYDALTRKETKIEEVKFNPALYDKVILGTPIWAGKMTPALRTYINLKKDFFKNISIFTTAGSSSEKNIIKEIETLTGIKSEKNFSIKHKDLKNNNYVEIIKKYNKKNGDGSY